MSGQLPPNPKQPDALRGFDAFELRLGDVMRGERATLGKSLIDVQRELKIKATYIAAIENADPSAFETPGFIAGYVRSYARYLQMDPEWAWDRFCREAGFEQPHGLSAKASAPKPQRQTGLDALGDPNASFVPIQESILENIEMRALGSIAVLMLLVGALGYGAWAVFKEVQRVELAPVDQTPGVVAELEPSASLQPTSRPDSIYQTVEAGIAAPTAESLDRLYRPRALDRPELQPRDGPIAAVEPGSVGVLAERPVRRSAPVPQTQQVAAPVQGSVEPRIESLPVPQVVADVAPDLQLLAVRPAWVRITAADGTILLEKILEPGERWTVPTTEEPPLLRSGNSGAIYFAVNGQTYGPLEPGAQVVRNVPLVAQSVVQTYALADTTTDPDLAAVAVADAAATAAASSVSDGASQ